MSRLIFIAICLCICHFSFAQNEKLEVEGAIVISNNDNPNPVAGTIRWTGQDFEGFDGTGEFWNYYWFRTGGNPQPPTDPLGTEFPHHGNVFSVPNSNGDYKSSQ